MTSFNPFGKYLTRAWLTDLETRADFWNRTPQLQLIAWRAKEISVNPWGVLAIVMENQASHVPPTRVLVQRNGKPGSDLTSGTPMSGYVGLVARPGGGKSVTVRKSSSLVPPATSPIAMADAAGIIGSIAETENGVTTLYNNVPVIHDETFEFSWENPLSALKMRLLWDGNVIRSTVGKGTQIPSNLYRIHGVWGVRTDEASSLMRQFNVGTPQRFVWAPAAEHRVFKDAPARKEPPSGVSFPIPSWGVTSLELPSQYRVGDPLPAPTWITFDQSPELRRWYADTVVDRFAGLVSDADTHTVLNTIKQSVKMAWLHGRCDPSDLDFELARIQMQVSTAVAAGVWNRSMRDNVHST